MILGPTGPTILSAQNMFNRIRVEYSHQKCSGSFDNFFIEEQIQDYHGTNIEKLFFWR